MLIVLVSAPCRGAVENLLINPGFEVGTTGWAGRNCTISTSDVSRSGDAAGYATNRTAGWQGIKQSLLGQMIPGRTYAISGYVRLDNAPTDSIILTVERRDDRGVNYIRIDSATGYSNRWILLSGTFTLDVVGTLTTLDVYFEGPDAGVNFYVDDAQVFGERAESPDESTAIGVVDVHTVYQELEGFGASGAWYDGWLTAHPLRNEIYDVLFGQLGLDIYRLRNTHGISTSNITRSAQIIAAAEASLGHPIRIMLSSWSPPAYLKSDANTVGGTLARDASGAYRYGDFAQWWVDSLMAYSAAGIDVDYASIQNEPDWLADWDTCKLTPTETAQWAGYNLAFEAVWQKANAQIADPPKWLVAEACGCGASQAYIDALVDPSHAYGYAHHLYADGDYDSPDAMIPAMKALATGYGDKPLFQSEYSRGSGEEPVEVALNLARHIHNSLVHEGVCSFFYWDLFWGEEGGLVSLDNPWRSGAGYTINHTYYAFKQYSAFTDPGWVRVAAATDSSNLRVSAFVSADGIELSVVIINVSDGDIDLSLSLEAFEPVESGVYRTSETENAAYVGSFDASQPLMLPGRTITTISLVTGNPAATP
jgi:glucuronoarabinoxylan endo-1,4-beta-xylanase